MLNRIDELFAESANFAFETTLATKSYKKKVVEAKKEGYSVTLLFFWLRDVDLAKQRVRERVMDGGHNIKPEVIERRYQRGLKNLFDIYLPIVDEAFIFDNSDGTHELLAHKQIDDILHEVNHEKFQLLKNSYADS